MAGFLIASWAGTPIPLDLGCGVLCGLGSGIVYSTVMSTVSAWFPDKQGMIFGLLLMGYGISGFFYGKIFAALAPADGTDAWRLVFRVCAILFFAVLLFCSFFMKRPGASFRPPAVTSKKKLRNPAAGRTLRDKKSLSPGQAYK